MPYLFSKLNFCSSSTLDSFWFSSCFDLLFDLFEPLSIIEVTLTSFGIRLNYAKFSQNLFSNFLEIRSFQSSKIKWPVIDLSLLDFLTDFIH